MVRACLELERAPVETVKATLAEMRRRRHEAQPQGIKTFGSTFKNPEDPRADGRSAGLLLAEAGCNGLAVGGARFAPKHANFIENIGTATTADVLALMAQGRARVLERFGVELEPEVQALGRRALSLALSGRGSRRQVEQGGVDRSFAARRRSPVARARGTRASAAGWPMTAGAARSSRSDARGGS